MSDTGQLPIMQAAKYTWDFTRASLLPTLPAYLIKSVLAGATFAATLSTLNGGAFPLDIIGAAIGFAISMSCLALTLRLAFDGEMTGFTGIKFGPEEGRLGLVHLMFGAVMFFLGFVFLFIASIIGAVIIAMLIPDRITMSTDPQMTQQVLQEFLVTPAGWLVIAIVFAVVILPLLYIFARLVTFPAATVARGKMMFFETWDWTKGQAFRVMLVIVIALGPLIVVNFVGAAIAALLTGFPVLMAVPDLANGGFSPLQGMIYGALTSLFSIPLYIGAAGLSAFMYRGFNPAED